MPGSANDALFRESFFNQLTRPVQIWFRELESKTRSDISPQGIVGSAKLNLNIPSNFSNNCTVDSVDNLINTTIRVYGPGGPGSSWHQVVGSKTGPEIPAFTRTALYSTQYWVYWDGTQYHASTSALDSFQDGIVFAGTVLTVAPGGAGGKNGGGTPNFGGGGIQR